LPRDNAGRCRRRSIRGSIIRGFADDLIAAGPSGGSGTIDVSSSNFSTADDSDAGGTIDQSGGGNVDLDPLFENAGVGDFRLQPASPMIDAAGTSPVGGEESATDFGGNPRITDGDGDLQPARDIGAYEHAPVPPNPPPDPDPVNPPTSSTTESDRFGLDRDGDGIGCEMFAKGGSVDPEDLAEEPPLPP
jgi:hypothetical protein